MITPEVPTVDITEDIPVEQPQEQTSRTYYIDWHKKQCRGYVDGLKAMEQAIFKVLETQRFKYLIYSWRYGFELDKLLGRSMSIVRSIAARLIKECLLADSRVTDIQNLTMYENSKRVMTITFVAITIYGTTTITREVVANAA